MGTSTIEILPYAFSPADAARFAGLGLTRIKTLLRTGALPFHKDGKRTLILRTDIETYLTNLAAGRLSIRRGDQGRFVSAVRHA